MLFFVVFLLCFAGGIASKAHNTQSKLSRNIYFFAHQKIYIDIPAQSNAKGHLYDKNIFIDDP
jgi:hypothetical protein